MDRESGRWRAPLGALALLLGQGTALGDPDTGGERGSALDRSLGRALFERTWVAAPASTDSADGLGPLYNARSCAACHPKGGRGRAPGSLDPAPVPSALVLHLSVPPHGGGQGSDLIDRRPRLVPEPTYGHQIQPLALPAYAAEGRLTVRYRETEWRLPDSALVRLRRPEYALADLGYGPLDQRALTSPRLAPALFGLGLLDSVPESEILAAADPLDGDGDGISGRANRVWDPVRGAVAQGRYGWKAGEPSLDAQIQTAFALDLGLGAPLFPDGAGDCTQAQPRCRTAPQGGSSRHGGLEAGPEVVDLVALFVRGLPVPPRQSPQDPAVLDGEISFRRIGCAGCHRPELAVQIPGGTTQGAQTQGQASIQPYTDLLLHDMGEGLADHRPEGDADGREWRTAPLWGLGLLPRDRAGLLHDGRARDILEAVLWHDGEARRSRDAFAALPEQARANLLRFLQSL